jgi:hypothetical protein
MTDTVQGEFPFANDFRVAIRVAKAALVTDVPEEAILGLVAEGKLESILVNEQPNSPRKHRRILANSLWSWMGMAWRFEIPVKPTFRPDEFADLFDISTRQARRLEKKIAGLSRRYGERGNIRFLREGIPSFIATRKSDA